MSNLGVSNVTDNQNIVARNESKAKPGSVKKQKEEEIGALMTKASKNKTKADTYGKIIGIGSAAIGLGIGLAQTETKLRVIEANYHIGNRTDKFSKFIAKSPFFRSAAPILVSVVAA